MTIFELVKIVLDELYEAGKQVHGDGLDAQIKMRLDYLSRSYAQLANLAREPVDYKDPSTRFAYVYMYVAAHGDYLIQILEKLQAELDSPIFDGEQMRLSCIGGGPGSDLIAVIKYLDESRMLKKVKKLTCYLLDAEQAWADTWTELEDKLGVNIRLNSNFQSLDVTKAESWANQRKFLSADIFTLSYFVSEVYSRDTDGSVTQFWQTLFASAKPGALFIYNDNGHSWFNEYFDKQWKKAKLDCILIKSDERVTLRGSEQKAELAQYLAKFGKTAKAQATTSYRVLRKA